MFSQKLSVWQEIELHASQGGQTTHCCGQVSIEKEVQFNFGELSFDLFVSKRMATIAIIITIMKRIRFLVFIRKVTDLGFYNYWKLRNFLLPEFCLII
jgi:hypothetical protein